MEDTREKREETSFYTEPLPNKRVREAYDPFNGVDPASFYATFSSEEEPEPEKPRKDRTGLIFLCAVLALGIAAAALKGMPLLPPDRTEATDAAPEAAAYEVAAYIEEAEEAPAPDQAAAPAELILGANELTEAMLSDIPEATLSAYVRTAVLVDGKPRGVLVSREAAAALLTEICAYYESEIRAAYDVTGALSSEIENAVELVESPDTPDAELMSSEALFAALTEGRSALKVLTTEASEAVETLPVEIKTENDKYLLKGTRIVTEEGREGRVVTLTTVTYRNGEKKSSNTGEAAVTQEKVDRSVREGTQKPDSKAEPGKREGKKGPKTELVFTDPIADGKIVSNFGQRAGVLHLGLDYTASTENAPVLAAGGGTVVCAMERGGYGLMLEIDHGDGFVTRYAHLSYANVSLGAVVAAGQPIGVIGESGSVSEPTLHFELRINGEAYNPRYYL